MDLKRLQGDDQLQQDRFPEEIISPVEFLRPAIVTQSTAGKDPFAESQGREPISRCSSVITR
ncbi:hypothetical protein Plim_2086 [Planctopirus limnophila DSM 3776]|uniref:Uncharacterized protein n=1 Tax=Planctopirus limnophila (strain ATCC 43296 / DSM 3776 / IFAM 1008 / Mu 290) TaxID=521674 RepID=D5SYY1_PLAL2|nr:hypothetical protein Plim_2086 [Planctopirus limnophila DSM 3776]